MYKLLHCWRHPRTRYIAQVSVALSVCFSGMSFGQGRSFRDVELAKDMAFAYVDRQSLRFDEADESTTKPISLDDVRTILSVGKVDVEILGTEIPNDVRQTLARIKEAFGKNPPVAVDKEALHQLLNNAGISDDELARIEESKQKATLTTIDTGRVRFIELPDDRFEVRDLRKASLLDGLIVDLKNDTASFQSYTLKSDRAIVPSADQVASGPYEARTWTKLSGSDRTQVTLFIGRLTKTDENMICLKSEFIFGGVALGGESLVIRFKQRTQD